MLEQIEKTQSFGGQRIQCQKEVSGRNELRTGAGMKDNPNPFHFLSQKRRDVSVTRWWNFAIDTNVFKVSRDGGLLGIEIDLQLKQLNFLLIQSEHRRLAKNLV